MARSAVRLHRVLLSYRSSFHQGLGYLSGEEPIALQELNPHLCPQSCDAICVATDRAIEILALPHLQLVHRCTAASLTGVEEAGMETVTRALRVCPLIDCLSTPRPLEPPDDIQGCVQTSVPLAAVVVRGAATTYVGWMMKQDIVPVIGSNLEAATSPSLLDDDALAPHDRITRIKGEVRHRDCGFFTWAMMMTALVD